jgi:hypothetical protein
MINQSISICHVRHSVSVTVTNWLLINQRD